MITKWVFVLIVLVTIECLVHVWTSVLSPNQDRVGVGLKHNKARPHFIMIGGRALPVTHLKTDTKVSNAHSPLIGGKTVRIHQNYFFSSQEIRLKSKHGPNTLE